VAIITGDEEASVVSTVEIDVEALEKSLRGSQVLHGIDLSIDPGEFCVVVGPSGCGKSTLLKCIAGLLDIERGRVFVGDEDVTDAPVEQRDMGFVFQEFEEALFPHMTVAENVAFGLRQSDRDHSSREIDRQVDEMLDLLAISEIEHDEPGELSGGQQQRVELARQLVRECEVVLLDDPLADLDYKLQKRMELELRRIHAATEGTFVYVTHDQDQALKLADTLVVMNQGRIEQAGSPEEVYERPRNAFVGRFIGDTNLLNGRILDRDGETVAVETPVGEFTALPGNADLDPEADVVLLIRPETIALGEAATHETNTLEARFEDRTYTGEMTEFALSVDGSDGRVSFRVLRPGNVSLDGAYSGDRVAMGLSPADAICFDRVSVIETETIDDFETL
jgi:ABC-type Fe3+/spermidine/putrescine transport system ATPase subunit